jgi:beta-lactamase regulating signal transducer with metallopeptidase domain
MSAPLWFSNLLFWSAQVALLVLAAGFLPRLFQIQQPRVLLAYWRALLAISLVLPCVQPWHRVPSIGEIVFAPDSGGIGVVSVSGPTATHWHLPSLQIVSEAFGAVILVGIAVRFVFLALGLLKLRQLRRASLPISSSHEFTSVLEEVSACVRVRAEFRLSSHVDSPVTFGFAQPVILLPEPFSSMGAQFQAAIACHELLHVGRRDWGHHLSEEIVRAALWFHPAIAWLVGRVRLAREQVVDLEVVRVTNARKPYLEALLQFTAGRARIAAIPAPPFLVERQLAERVALMLKEVRMSRTRLIASLTAIACAVALAATLAVWAFPLKAAPRAGQNRPASGIAGGVLRGVVGNVVGGVLNEVLDGVAGGVRDGIAAKSPAEGIKGGPSGGVSGSGPADVPDVDRSTIWIDMVRRGPMVRQVRGLGTLVRAEDSGNLVAMVRLPDLMVRDVQLNQNAIVGCHSQKATFEAKGHVSHISPLSSNGARSVDIALDTRLPDLIVADLQITGTIDIERLEDVLYVGRPIHGTPNTSISLFKIVSDGTEAVRANVKFGRGSVQTIEVLDGLKAGDQIILSDMSNWDNVDRIHLK